MKDFSAYCKNFEDVDSETRFAFESTPHYFRLPRKTIDVGKRIRTILGDVPLILMLRDPVERYLSAYTHHMMQGRVPETHLLEGIVDKLGISELGFYASILEHYQSMFSTIHVRLYDDLLTDKAALIQSLMDAFELENDILPGQLEFRTNAKDIKAKKQKIQVLPKLSDSSRSRLKSLYREDTNRLQEMIGRDLGQWLS